MNYLTDDMNTWDQAYEGWGCCGCPTTGAPAADYKGLAGYGLVANPSVGRHYSSRSAYGGVFDNLRTWWQNRSASDRAGLLERIREWRAARQAGQTTESIDDWIVRMNQPGATTEDATAMVPRTTFWQRLRSAWQDRAPVDTGTREEWLSAGTTVAASLMPSSGRSGVGMSELEQDAFLAQSMALAEAQERERKKKIVIGAAVAVGVIGVLMFATGRKKGG